MKSNIIISLVLLCINYNIFYNFYLLDGDLFNIIYQVVVYYVVIFFTVNLFAFSKILQTIWFVALLAISLFQTYFINSMGIEINAAIIKNTLQTNIQEATELLASDFILYSTGSFIFIFVVYRYVIVNFVRIKIVNYIIITISTLVVFFGLTKIDNTKYRKFIKFNTAKISPVNFIIATQKYIHTSSRDQKIVKQNISKDFTYNKKDNTPLLAMLIIGESARADRFSINGYGKPTTRLLEQEINIISFIQATSCDTSTISSVPCMIQRFNRENFDFPIEETSLVQVFSDLGFDTYWLTLQDEANVIKTFCTEAKHCIDISKYKYDIQSLDDIKKIVSNISKDTLIVVHTMGSHFNYNSRVEDKNKVFKPTEQDGVYKAGVKLDNSYDNTIYQTDKFLANLYNIVKDKNSFVLYSSDHGESLGEKQYGVFSRYGHASPYDVAPKEQTNVPFILWYSNKFKKINNLNMVKNIKNLPISHDYIFSTMLGCSGFKSKYIEDRYNICKILSSSTK
jgi:lipid A ethanolaminephosphotransferase